MDDRPSQYRQDKKTTRGLRPGQLLLVLAIVAVFAILIAIGFLSGGSAGPPTTYSPGQPFRSSQPPP